MELMDLGYFRDPAYLILQADTPEELQEKVQAKIKGDRARAWLPLGGAIAFEQTHERQAAGGERFQWTAVVWAQTMLGR